MKRISYETAKLAFEKGYLEYDETFYNKHGNLVTEHNPGDSGSNPDSATNFLHYGIFISFNCSCNYYSIILVSYIKGILL